MNIALLPSARAPLLNSADGECLAAFGAGSAALAQMNIVPTPAKIPQHVARYGECLFVYRGVKAKASLFYSSESWLAARVNSILTASGFLEPDTPFELSHLVRAYAESAVRSCGLAQFTDAVLAARSLHTAGEYQLTYRCEHCARLVASVSALTQSKRAQIRLEEVLRR